MPLIGKKNIYNENLPQIIMLKINKEDITNFSIVLLSKLKYLCTPSYLTFFLWKGASIAISVGAIVPDQNLDFESGVYLELTQEVGRKKMWAGDYFF